MRQCTFLDALVRPQQYHRRVNIAVHWWIAGAAFFGGTCFIVGSFSGSSVLLVQEQKAGLSNAYNWLVYFTFCVGSYLFTLGCFLLMVAALNENFQEQYVMWKLQPHIRPKPHYRWLGVRPESVVWWGGLFYTVGAVLYNIGTTVNLADQFTGVTLVPGRQFVLERVTFLVGGVGFLLGGASYVLDSKGKGFLQGVTMPVSKADFCSLDYWVNWLNFWGGVGFFGSGVFLMFPDLDITAYRIENAIGFGIGSCCFWLGGLLLFIKLSLGHDESSSYQSIGDDSVKGDSVGSIALSDLHIGSPFST